MSKIKVNDTMFVEGKFSFNAINDETCKPPRFTITGGFQTAEYIEEITSLENNRYVLNNVKVNQEAFGSEDATIMYEFTAGSFRVKTPSERG